MENLIISLNVVLPLFLMMALGYLLKCLHLFPGNSLNTINNLCFKVFLPILLYYNIYQTRLEGVFDLKLALFAAGCVVAGFFLALFIVPRLEKDNRKRGVLVQGIFRSNFILFGLPITISLVGKEQSGVTALMIAIVIPLFNMLAVTALELFRGEKVRVKAILKGIIANPLIWGCVLGILTLLLRVRFPSAVETALSDLAGIATPLALVVLGGFFHFKSIKGYGRQLILGLGGKLVLIPALFLPLSILLGFRGAPLVSLLSMFASPVAVSSFIMAQNMDGDADLAAQLVVLGSACSIVTLFVWVLLIKSMGFV